MPALVDTNILLRSAQPNHPLCQPATRAVATPLSRLDAVAEVRSIEEMLTLLPDSPAIYPEWKRIVKDVVWSILTCNGRDFARYTHISIIEPTQV
jgi:hypothetical protein